MLLYIILSLCAFAQNITNERYLQWRKDFDIGDRAPLENISRFELWKKFVLKYGVHNLNPYSDFTESERKEFFATSANHLKTLNDQLNATHQVGWVNFPSSWVAQALQNGRDWRAEGKTTRAKNQGQQPYCGTFSRVGGAESTFAIGGGFKNKNKRQNPLTDFSVEEVVDCCGWNKNQDDVIFNKGFMTWQAYPFDTSKHDPDVTQPCRYNPSLKIPGSTMDAYVKQQCGNDKKACEEQMAAWIYYNGPMQGGITAEVFYNADEDHFVTPSGCNVLNFDHGIIYVGFGTDPVKGDYWLIKNSWGANWQDQGYIKVARGVNCGGLAGSGMAYMIGDSDDYLPGPSSYLGPGICSGTTHISSSASSLEEAREQAKSHWGCKVFFYSQYSTTWGVYCGGNVNCQRDGNTNWNAYRV